MRTDIQSRMERLAFRGVLEQLGLRVVVEKGFSLRRGGQVQCAVEAFVLDSDETDGQKWLARRRFTVTEGAPLSTFSEEVLVGVLDWVNHEAREGLRIDGVWVDDPHGRGGIDE